MKAQLMQFLVVQTEEENGDVLNTLFTPDGQMVVSFFNSGPSVPESGTDEDE